MSLSDASDGMDNTLAKLKAAKKSIAKGSTKGLSFKVGGTSFDLGGDTKKGKANGKKKATAKTNGHNEGEDAADTDEKMLNAAIKASYVTAADEIRKSMSSAGAGPSTSRRARQSMSVSPKKKWRSPQKKSAEADSDSDVPLARVGRKSGGEDDSASEEASNADGMDLDSDLSDEDAVLSRIADMEKKLQADRQAKAIQKQEESKERKRLGRKLTYVSFFSVQVYYRDLFDLANFGMS